MNTRSKFHWLARAGYGARGVVFLMIAALALFSSLAGGRPDTQSALTAILQQPFGRIWIGLIGLGLAGFVIWRLAQSMTSRVMQSVLPSSAVPSPMRVLPSPA